jgi:hypothetical protein
MTHDPARDCEHGRLKGKCDVCDLQAEINRLVSFNNQLMDEEARLNKALTWEQNRSGRIGTHGPDATHGDQAITSVCSENLTR